MVTQVRFFLRPICSGLAIMILIVSPLRAEWRIGFFLGKASTSNSDLKIEQPSRQNHLLFHDIEYTDKSFRTPLYYGLRAGYFPPDYPNFGGEIEFIHAKIYSNSEHRVRVSGIRNGDSIDSTMRLGDIVQGFSMSHGLNFLFFNLVGRIGFSRGKLVQRIMLNGRVGIGPLIPHAESVIDGKGKEQYEVRGPAYQASLGTDVKIWKNLNWLLEYKYTYVRMKDAKVAYGWADTEFSTGHMVSGIVRRF